jgi:hypothetical protein
LFVTLFDVFRINLGFWLSPRSQIKKEDLTVIKGLKLTKGGLLRVVNLDLEFPNLSGLKKGVLGDVDEAFVTRCFPQCEEV